MKKLLVTGSNGLIGSAMAYHFHELGWQIHGLDNNMRADFFSPDGDTRWNQCNLQRDLDRFIHHESDIRNRAQIQQLIQSVRPNAIIHTAAQPSHDLAALRPFDDFDVNAGGTLNLLEATRNSCPEAPFVHLSTNKVYGDAPNSIQLKELTSRWDYDDPLYAEGISETFSIDGSMHSLFGSSKLAADIFVQEYGRYFGMPTCSLRCGCLTGPAHTGVELHGFLSYLVKVNLSNKTYRIHGYKGKQVRDNIHADDVALFAELFIASPRPGEVYNCGGGRDNSCSIKEAFEEVERRTDRPTRSEYLEKPRKGDHICYISNLAKMKQHYPTWTMKKSLDNIFDELVSAWITRLPKVEDSSISSNAKL